MSEMHRALLLIEQSFREEPFHTLRMLYNKHVWKHVAGGTCSDKVISFVEMVSAAGFSATICNAFIGNQEIHRIARLTIDERVYFVDVGNGWPSLMPYPTDESIEYTRFGMTFRTVIRNDRIMVFHQSPGVKGGKEYKQMEILLTPRAEKDVMNDIEKRFDAENIGKYPFSNRMRFSAIIDDKFLFLRDNSLLIYEKNGLEEIISVTEDEWENTLLQYFRCAVNIPDDKEEF